MVKNATTQVKLGTISLLWGLNPQLEEPLFLDSSVDRNLAYLEFFILCVFLANQITVLSLRINAIDQ
jgi:hypothetical protein